MKTVEIPIVFSCQSDDLIGVIHQPETPIYKGVLVVVGGPQYRVGSHRQFVLLARMLAANGVLVMRFDYRGMGDSAGQAHDFSDIDEDINLALDAFYRQCPDLSGVVIWGLCDAASAATFYAYQDERVTGLILLNPWVFTEQGAAKTYLKHYYIQRFINPDLWRKVFSLQFDYRQSFSSLVLLLKSMLVSTGSQGKASESAEILLVDSGLSLPDRVRECLLRFNYPVLFILSGRDLTADEYRGVVKADKKWQVFLERPSVSTVKLTEADHTFSSQKWREEVSQLTLQWILQLH